ncbi:hypothetical protein [Parerythrobacter aestuarii]|uniref:hypothetical protein n=1 Tax=Parerythrobacter aestuarii TaxID=3020909 RepID=UPI0024DF03DA|nr:hypothetical protein [Parerythrobacter aestuarii]
MAKKAPNTIREVFVRLLDDASGKPIAGARADLVIDGSPVTSAASAGKDMVDGGGVAMAAAEPVVSLASTAGVVIAAATTDRDGLARFSSAGVSKAFEQDAALAVSLDGGASSIPLPVATGWLDVGAINVRVPSSDFSFGAFGGIESVGPASRNQPNWTLDTRALDLSPNIFPGFEDLHFGDDRCERMIPNDNTMRHFEHAEIIVRDRNALQCDGANGVAMNIHVGELLSYDVTWKRLGYSFGELIYSLALAPGEHVTLAISSWEQRQMARMSRESVSAENASSDYTRANSLVEVMNMTSSNFQSSLGIGLSIPSINMNVSAAVSYDRTKVAANASRQFNETIQQNAHRMRQDRQTIVAEQSETETSSVSYRAVCNRNYCHALNMFFHEVLENHRVSTYLTGHRKVLLVPHQVKDFDAHRAFCTHGLLKHHILDDCVDDCCESLKHVLFSGKGSGPAAAAGVDAARLATTVNLTVSLGETPHMKDNSLTVFLFLRDGSMRSVKLTHDEHWPGNASYSATGVVDPFDPADVTGVSLKNGRTFWMFGGHLDIMNFAVSTTDPQLGEVELAKGSIRPLRREEMSKKFPSTFIPPQAEVAGTADHEEPKDHQACVAAYVAHLNCHKHYYNAILWMLGDVNERVAEYENYTCNGGVPLSHHIDPTPLGVWGNYVAFGAADGEFEPLDEPQLVADRLVVLPSSGVFADIALGQCTSCETLPGEDDPFWKVIDKPNKCGGADISPVEAESDSLIGDNSLAFATPSTTAWATFLALQNAEANSLQALVKLAVEKELAKKDPTAPDPPDPKDNDKTKEPDKDNKDKGGKTNDDTTGSQDPGGAGDGGGTTGTTPGGSTPGEENPD